MRHLLILERSLLDQVVDILDGHLVSENCQISPLANKSIYKLSGVVQSISHLRDESFVEQEFTYGIENLVFKLLFL